MVSHHVPAYTVLCYAVQLRSLEIEQCPYPDVPATLTALTRLRLVSAEEQNYAVFGSNLSALSQLKVRSTGNDTFGHACPFQNVFQAWPRPP